MSSALLSPLLPTIVRTALRRPAALLSCVAPIVVAVVELTGVLVFVTADNVYEEEVSKGDVVDDATAEPVPNDDELLEAATKDCCDIDESIGLPISAVLNKELLLLLVFMLLLVVFASLLTISPADMTTVLN